MHVVAQSIVSVLPDNDEEKRTLENYLQGSDCFAGRAAGRFGIGDVKDDNHRSRSQ